MASTSSSPVDAKGKRKAFEDSLPQPLGKRTAFEDILPQPPLPSASSSSSMVCDVFLNHRGCDVKEGFAQDIYDALNRKVSVFLDKNVIEHGASIPIEIEDAMLSASLCIAIFSPKYAESVWCLEELSFMVKNKKNIIPIFYNVEISDLRWVATKVNGVYAEAFSKQERKGRYTEEKLHEWKTAVSDVANRYGYALKEDEGALVDTIVKCVRNYLKPQLEVAKHPVGLGEIVGDFYNIAFKYSHREQHVNVVGIAGMGGSGKTTLAKKLYNRECLNIDRQSFISDVRDFVVKRPLHELPKKLLVDLLPKCKDINIDNVTEGKEILRTRLRSLRVLIVLDDVDHVEQIDALLLEKSIYAAGSLIVVTTRDSKVLKSSNISCIYKVKPLNESNAKQLLCWHAFKQSDPVQDFKDLVDEAMNACKGLPLSLKILGAQLYQESKEYWVSLLDKISKELLPDVTKILKVSFDALDRKEKEMFLDATCFFLGERKSLAIEVWDGSGWSGQHGWETLLSKCLVELDQQNRIGMHDHLRDMGRQIAMERQPYRLFIDFAFQFRKECGFGG